MNELMWDIAKVLGGVFFSGLSLYFVVIQKVSRIQGKLDILIGMMKLSEENKEHIGRLKSAYDKQQQDINFYFQRVKGLETRVSEIEDPPLSQQ